MKVLFIGNSITRHAPKHDINWFGDHGMAATKFENDYVHQCVNMLSKHFTVQYMLKNIADWEMDFCQFDYSTLINEQMFAADILIMRISENLNQEYCMSNSFSLHYLRLIEFLINNNPKCKVITTSNFWGFGKKLFSDKAIANLSREKGYYYIELGDMSDGNKYKAYPNETFNPVYADNIGVCEHPNDAGMYEIAKRIYLRIKEIIL